MDLIIEIGAHFYCKFNLELNIFICVLYFCVPSYFHDILIYHELLINRWDCSNNPISY